MDYTAEPTQSTIRRWLPVALIVAVMIGARIVLLTADAVPFNSDEAIVALMARHILQGERPAFFYGQAYLGSTDAWLVAIAFSIFGQAVWAMRVVQITLFAATLFTTHAVARRFGLSEWASRVTVVWMALPPVLLTLYTTATLGGYGETLLFGNILILLAPAPTSDLRPPTSNLRWIALGVVAGFAFYTFGLILVYLIPIAIGLLAQHRLKVWRGYALALIGFAIGSVPWWSSIGQLGGSLLAELGGSAVASSVAAPTSIGSLGVQLINFVVFGFSAWFGLRYPWSVEWIVPPVGLAVTMFYAAALALAIRRGPKLLWGMIGVLLGTYLITPFGGDPSGRYFLPLYLPLAIFAALAMERLRGRLAGWLVGLLVAVVIGYNGIAVALAAARVPPGITTQFDAVTWIDKAHDEELIDFLLAHGETRGYANYWVAYPIAFLSGEQIISVPRLPYHLDLRYTRRDDRYPPYAQTVTGSPRAFYVTTNHPPLDALIHDRLTALGVVFNEETIGSYHIFYGLSRKVVPEELGLGQTTD